MMIKNVAVYCRVSTDEQKKFGISVKDQKNSLTRYCKQNNYKIYDYYIDEGISAGSISKRKALVKLLKNLDNIDLILFTKLDRFSRNVKDANDLLVILDEHNVAFRAIDEEDIDVSTADGRFIFNLKVNLAEHERKKDSERINRVNKYKYEVSKTVCTGKIPYGYKISKDKKMIIDEEKSKHIEELFDYYLKTNNLNDTTRWFSETYVKRSLRMIKHYLNDSSYIGIFKTTSGLILDDFCEAIIDEETFNKVQKSLERNVKRSRPDPSRKRHNAEPYIFSGLLKCPKCGCSLSGKVNTTLAHYYRCRKHEMKVCEYKKCISEKDIEKYVLNNIKTVLEKAKLNIDNINRNNSNTIISIDNIKNKINKLTNLYMNDLVDIDYYKLEYSDLQRQLSSAKEHNSNQPKINKEDIDRINNLLTTDFLSLYDTFDNLEKRRLWASIIDYIIVNDKNDLEIVVY